jgi:hypothetical protein
VLIDQPSISESTSPSAIPLVAGIVASDADKDKAAGVNVNLWVGIALLLACAVFWAWALIRPLSEVLSESGKR